MEEPSLDANEVNVFFDLHAALVLHKDTKSSWAKKADMEIAFLIARQIVLELPTLLKMNESNFDIHYHNGNLPLIMKVQELAERIRVSKGKSRFPDIKPVDKLYAPCPFTVKVEIPKDVPLPVCLGCPFPDVVLADPSKYGMVQANGMIRRDVLNLELWRVLDAPLPEDANSLLARYLEFQKEKISAVEFPTLSTDGDLVLVPSLDFVYETRDAFLQNELTEKEAFRLRVAMSRCVEQGTDVWLQLRKFRITGSASSTLLNHNPFAAPVELIRSVFSIGQVCGETNSIISVIKEEDSPMKKGYMQYGHDNEPNARKAFEEYLNEFDEFNGCELVELGMYVPPLLKDMEVLQHFAFSPDNILINRKTRKTYLVEYKCPAKRKVCYTKMPSYYMDQLMLGMGLMGIEGAFFGVWTPNEFTVEYVAFDPIYFWTQVVPGTESTLRKHIIEKMETN